MSAIETAVPFGIYYAISENPDRKWDITNTIIDTVFSPDTTSNGTAQAIYLSNESGGDGPDNVSVTGNRINNVRSNRSTKAVLIGAASPARLRGSRRRRGCPPASAGSGPAR